MRVHLAQLGSHRLDTPARLLGASHVAPIGAHTLTDDPESADLILFTQCHMLGRDWRLNAIRDHPLTRRHREKVQVYDERDSPWCAFPGSYVSMPASRFMPDCQRASGYLFYAPIEADEEPDLLFSFMGSATHRCRSALFSISHSEAIVERVRGFTFFDPSSLDWEARRKRFRAIVGRSHFVLCPRGGGTSSIRLYETLSAGRVPVIISDDWKPPEGADWDRFSLRWPEGRVDGLAEMLEGRIREWPEMSRAAREAYQLRFAPPAAFRKVLDDGEQLLRARATRNIPPAGLRNAAFRRAGFAHVRSLAETSVRRTARRGVSALGFGSVGRIGKR